MFLKILSVSRMWKFFVAFAVILCALVNSSRGRLNTYVSITDLEDQEFAQGASTLAFVFDTTGSMYDDLRQVIEGASKILSTILERREKPIYNYVLVPFHDPEIGPVMETTNPVEFQHHLRNLYVHGGGDCPEMSIGAIKLALDASLSNSFIYVFTDARSKDFYRLQEVLSLVQRKESQVVFVMTGDCGNQSHPGYQAYEQIAATSSGQIFQLTKTDVEQVLNFVRLSLEARKVNLLATDKETSDRSIIQLIVDPTLREFTISLSGDNPQIDIYEPNGNKKEPTTGVNTLLNLKNVHIVNIKNPTPGPWHVQISSDSSYSLRATGLSSVDFVHGFSLEPTPNFHETHYRPLKSAQTYLIINGTEVEDMANLNYVQLLDLSGNILEQVHLTPIIGHEGLYNATPFVPPDDYFYLKISGVDERGFFFQRISSTAISAQLPDVPEVILDSRIDAFYKRSVTLTCQIQSLVPFKVAWYRGDQSIYPISREYHFQQSNEIKYHILTASGDHEDWYWCNASNIAGQTAMKVFLDVKDPPPIIWKHENVSTVIGQTVSLDCLIHSAVPFSVSWAKFSVNFKKPHFSSALIENDPRYKNFGNGSLAIKNISISDEGWFKCTTRNEGGSSYEKIFLQILEPPRIVNMPEDSTFKKNDTVEIYCQADGYPEPSIIWKLENNIIEDYGRIRVEGNKLVISNATQFDEASYKCIGENSAGIVNATATLQYVEAPQILNYVGQVLVNRGDRTTLICEASGIPTPTIHWFKNLQEIHPLPYMQFEETGSLKIIGVQDSDAGEFTCKASNEAGNDEVSIKVDVGYPPALRQSQQDIAIDIEKNGTIICDVVGNPQPKISWSRRSGDPIDWQRYFVLPNGNLHITYAKLSDEDFYVCHIQNLFGTFEEETLLVITGIEKPMLGPIFTSSFVLGQKAELQCPVISGNPKPLIKWTHNDDEIPSISKTVSLYTIVIEKVDEHHAGNYTCNAENVGGYANQTTFITVQGPPKILEESSKFITSKKGYMVELPCNANGYPVPEITWNYNDELINFQSSHYMTYKNGSLAIVDVSSKDIGTYTCLATNPFGIYKTSLILNVEESPIVIKVNSSQWIQEGEYVTLACAATGNPEPIIQWFHDDLVISNAHTKFKTSLSKAGTYKCVASNYLGQDVKTMELSVTVPPSIHGITKQPLQLLRGDTASLNCQVVGVPRPNVTWQLNGILISHNTTLIELKSDALPSENHMTCTATNSAGSVISEIFFFVYEKPSIIHSDVTEFIVLINETVILSCNAEGFPKPVIKWMFNVSTLKNDETNFLLPNNSLLLKNVKRKSAGVYTCFATNDVGNNSLEFSVVIHVPPQVAIFTETPVLVENNSLSITCNFTGNPLPDLTWLKNNHIINYKFFSVSHNSIFIEQAFAQDAGVYSCVGTNSAGTARDDVIVTVLVPPKLSGNNLEYLNVHSGQEISLSCLPIGNPLPTIIWNHNDNPVNVTDGKHEIDSTGKVLTFNGVTIEDLGEIKCIATNNAGNASKSFVLNVYEPPRIKDGTQLETINVNEEDNLLLECSVLAHPKPLFLWLKNNQPFTSWSNTTIANANGHYISQIFIASVATDDEGRYTCITTNKAGVDQKDFIINVLVPPHMDHHYISTVEVFLNRPITLACAVTGKPTPTVSWFKDGEPIFSVANNSYVISEDGSTFQIMKALASDGGTYTCIALNDAGQEIKNFNVTILVSPKIEASERIVKIISNETLKLLCQTSGYPFPNITWMKNNLNLNDQRLELQNQSQFLIIQNIQEEDAGDYLCLATNIAGSVQKDFTVYVIIPPFLEAPSIMFHQVRQNFPVTLECTVSGIPFPSINWFNEDNNILPNLEDFYISHDSKMLKLLAAKLQNTGHYFCNATNEGGYLEIDFYIEVIVPPRIIFENTELKYKILEGNHSRLFCKVEGIPRPLIIWIKDGEILQNQTNSRVFLVNDDQELYINEVHPLDSGVYVCIATNDAGSTEKKFIVDVLVPPASSSDKLNSFVEVLENRPLFLPCQVTGIPTPSVKWLKDGLLLTQSRDLNIFTYAGTNVLKLKQVQFHDGGIYQCVAINEVGQLEQTFNVSILVPPVIHNNQLHKQLNGISQVTARVNDTTKMECIVTGYPQPKVIWLYRGQLINHEDQYFYKENNSYMLLLSGIQSYNSGQYACVAANAAGTAEKEFQLTVLVPPQLDIENEHAFFNDVLINRPVSMTCPVDGNPKPTIHWFKDRKKLNITDTRSTFRLLLDGYRLQILQTRPDHGGNYTCEASNIVGTLNVTLGVLVQVPPNITKTLNRLNVLENESITLQCIITGNPFPTVTWLKDNHIIDSANLGNLNMELMKREQVLKIRRINPWHDGKYSCIATNEVGIDEHEITVYVNIPPIIDSSLHNKRHAILVGRNAIIECKVTAKPPAKIKWFKQENLINSVENPLMRILNSGQKLQIIRSREADSGKYSCIATNIAGENKATFHVDVLVPPSIDGDLNEGNNIRVLEGDTLDIECYVNGNPFPEVTWYKDGNVFTGSNDDRIQLLFEEQLLHFSVTRLSDGGAYTCTATSMIGTAEKHLELTVLVPPRLTSVTDSNPVTLLYDPVTFECHADGFPQPVITWLKNGNPVNMLSDPNIQILNDGEKMQIQASRLSDAGYFSCLAVNIAGDDKFDFALQIQVPPRIDRSNTIPTQILIENEAVVLECPASGIPIPSITWLKNGQELVPGTDFKIQIFSDGEKLRISDMHLEDAGQYTCIASNEVGTDKMLFELEILSPPQMNDGDRSLHVREGDIVTLSCPLDLVALPLITWKKDGQVLDSKIPIPNVALTPNDADVKIMGAHLSDSGTYTCIATNQAGQSMVNFHVEVLVPSKIQKLSSNSVKVTEGQTISLPCLIEGNPLPEITWLKDKNPILGINYKKWISGNDIMPDVDLELQTINEDEDLQKPQRGDVALMEEYEELVNQNMSIDFVNDAWIYRRQSSLVNEIPTHSITPQLLLEWNNEKVKILDGGSLLVIRNATVDDSGNYSCVATNDVGTDQQHVTVSVMTIPSIDLNTDHLVKISVDQKLVLNCSASGIPNPRVIWYKDSHPLSLNSAIQVSPNGELVIIKTKLTDAGLYSCIAINEAGEDDADFTVMILVPPTIDTLRISKLTFAVLNQSAELECVASGVPHPVITWYKENNHIPTNQVNLNNMLKIKRVSFDDAGNYTCHAVNDVGHSTGNITLNVLVPPNINGFPPPTVLDVLEHTPLSLICPLKGNPLPNVSWTKNEHLLLPTEKMQFIENKFKLWISSVMQDDAGFYKCNAVNEAGKFDFSYQVNVLVPPYFTEGFVDIVATMHHSVFLNCKPYGNPTPQITWSKLNGSNITFDNADESELYIARVGLAHNGTYQCLAKNTAGEAVKLINLFIHVPPTIENKFDEDINAIAEDSIILECQADGIPLPIVTWYKEGQLLIDDGSPNSRISVKNNDLHVADSHVADSGIYMCLATNTIGIASKEFKVNVMVPPSFQDPFEQVVKILGESTQISCKASGFPEPNISWIKINASRSWRNSGIISAGAILFQQIQLEDAGVYLCTAMNLVGIAKKAVNLIVHMSPAAESIDETIRVVRNSPLELTCKIKGIPEPKIYWKKENRSIFHFTSYNFSSTGSLIVSSTSTDMAGDYICIGENEVGIAEVHKTVIVIVSPRIISSTTNYTVNVNEQLRIPCKSNGYPLPSIEWKRAEQNVYDIDKRYSVSAEGTLVISSAVLNDAGLFQCFAKNEAGTTSENFGVLVLVSPSIKTPSSTKIKVNIRNSTILSCRPDGHPSPSVSWIHNFEVLRNFVGNKEVLSSGDLIIHQAMMTDVGVYTCIASNDAGKAELTYVLDVLTSPVLTHVPAPNVDIVVNSELTIVCEALGNPMPVIQWIHNNSILNVTNTTNSLMFKLSHIHSTDSGIYTCLAKNAVGQQEASTVVNVKVPPVIVQQHHVVTLHENERAELPCMVDGNPEPTVVWMKNNKRLNGELIHENMTTNILVIETVTVKDAGTYKCIAMNDVGVAEKNIELIVSKKPYVNVQPALITAPQGSVVLIHCHVHAKPEPIVQWKYEDKLLQTENHITIFPNNTLRIAAVEILDSGSYICMASNMLGSSQSETLLKVKVDGAFSSWGDWNPCTVSCGHGKQTRYRFCNNPYPLYGGLTCQGSYSEERVCAAEECPGYGIWSGWNEWLPCSASCGKGTQLRIRKCINLSQTTSETNCAGDSYEEIECVMVKCPETAVRRNWAQWASWSECTHTCGKGQQKRERICDIPTTNLDEKNCEGVAFEIRECNHKGCITDGEWSSWSAWSSCSHSCGRGTHIRERKCLFLSSNNDIKHCKGLSQQISDCNINKCPVHGNWSPWSLWEECSESCGGGHRKRIRTCNNPSPEYGGKTCTGLFQTTEPCNTYHCPVHGHWSIWSEWSLCSTTCGEGNQMRSRTCSNPSPTYGGKKCDGNHQETKICNSQPCPNLPQHAIGKLIGYVNAEEIGLSTISVNISYGNESKISGLLSDITFKQAMWMKSLTSLFSPIYWSFADEVGDAVNGYSLTKGFFQRHSEVAFPSGEVLKMTHIARGVNNNKTLLIDIVLTGSVPEFSDDITFDDYNEDYIQTGSGSIYAHSTRTIQTNGYVYPYAWNHSLIYDESEGTMPFLVQQLHTRNIGVKYNEFDQTLNFVMGASISKKNLDSTCSTGFMLDESGPSCADINECVLLHSCSHGCANYPGSYACVCPEGFSLGSNGHTCFDIDECIFGISKCTQGYECQNSIGSYMCVASCDSGFQIDELGSLCTDIDECKQIPEVCDQLCINEMGSYNCECTLGFQKIGKGNCIDIDECSLFPRICSHLCENTPGSYTCGCPPGYTLFNVDQCIDTDECSSAHHQCPTNSVCENIDGGYQCHQTCPIGFTTANNGSCTDIDECHNRNVKCSNNQICQNTVGSYKCLCPSGYYFVASNEPCIDIDECTLRQCQHDCENTVGSFRCSCPTGYRLANNGKNCIDIDECSELNIRCRPDESCFNTRGSFECLYTPCPPQYHRNDVTGHCTLPCDEGDISCPAKMKFQEVLMYRMVAVPSGIQAKQELVQLAAFDQDGHQLPYTMFNIVENESGIPFQIKLDGGKGILYPLKDLTPGSQYSLKVNAISYDDQVRSIQYKTHFFIIVAVSVYPY